MPSTDDGLTHDLIPKGNLMKKNWLALPLTIALAAFSAPPLLQAQDKVAGGDSAAGKEKSGSCAGCHGEDGNSLMPSFPKLAQQHSSYIIKQLHAFKDGNRNDPVMAPMALALSDDDMADLGAYFSGQAISANPEPTLPPPEDPDAPVDEQKAKETMQTLLATGSNLYRNGNRTSEVSACIACHGPRRRRQ